MNMNRFLFILCLLLSFAGGGSVIQAADDWKYPTSKPETPFGGGDGSQWNPYRIDNAQHLANLAYMVNEEGKSYKGKYLILTNDITLNDNVLNPSGTGLRNTESSYKEWIIIGKEYIFCGNFDGQGHTIRGMVCTTSDKYNRYGFFMETNKATIKNIKMEDCCLKEDDANFKARIGILCGYSRNSTFMNCEISNSAVIVRSNLGVNVGGIIGYTDKGTNSLNCRFDGYISITEDDYSIVAGAKRVGGIVGNQEWSSVSKNCSSSGEIVINCTHDGDKYDYHIGGISGALEKSSAYNCVSSMNMHINSPNNGISSCCVGGIAAYYSEMPSYEIRGCAYFGKISIGDATTKSKVNNLWVSGIGGNAAYVSGCAVYGSFDIHLKVKNETKIAGLSNVYSFGDMYKQNVVYSAGNVIDVETNDMDIDQVCNQLDNGDKHKDYYHFALSTVGYVGCKYTENTSIYYQSLVQMKTDDFINKLNEDAGSNIWGKLTGMSNELNGLPMPIACGGKPIGYTGEGTQSNPYVINSENDLNRFKEYVNSGSNFVGKYFKLGSDINMTEIMDYSIGFDKEKPFKGHLDGNGHAIVGLRNQLFGYMYGTVKNLAIIDCYIKSQGWTGAIAGSVGDENNKAEVSNCYVSGLVQASGSSQILLGGICGNVASGSSVHDSYFKGHLIVESGYNSSGGSHFVGGISGYNGGTVDTTTPQGIYNCYASFKYQKATSSCFLYGISNGGVKDCYVVTSATIDINNSGCTKLNSESELNGTFNGKAGWLQGVYRPVLASAKHYKAKSPEGTDAYFDAIPEANPTPNYFYNISIDDPYSDVSLWSLPNMAVYVPSEKKDYITNGYLDQSADFKYNRASGATATAGQLRYDLTQTEKGYHLVCLPGVVEKSDLPEGTKVMIVGNVTGNESDATRQVNVVMVEDIPAGVPCFVYVPTTTVTQGKAIPLVMRSGIVSEPQNETYGSLKGTFVNATKTDVCVSAQYNNSTDKLPYFIRTAGNSEVKPFSAWLEGANGDVKIVDYVLLDEENETMTVSLAELNNKQTNLKMRRTLKTENWNTICLPYSLTSAEISTLFGSGTKVEAFSSLEYNNESDSYTLKFTAATEMIAGTPYLIKPATAKADNIFDMQNKTIACASATTLPAGTSQTVNSTTLTMQGEYNHRMISPDEATGGKSIYVISGNKIYYVDSEVEMKGFRCYFVAEETASGSGAKLFSGARLMHSDGSSTELRLIKAEAQGDVDAVYDLLGRKRDGQTNGLVIKNGKKVLKN